MTTKQDYQKLGDLVKYGDSKYYLEGGTLDAQTYNDFYFGVGVPVKHNGTDWVAIINTDEANAEGLLGTDVGKVASGVKPKVVVVRRGPTIINETKIRVDGADGGTDLVLATVKTALETNTDNGVKPIFKTEPAETTEGAVP